MKITALNLSAFAKTLNLLHRNSGVIITSKPAGTYLIPQAQILRTFSSTPCNLSSEHKIKTMNSAEDDVLFETINGKGIITLNRPKALNALNLSMVKKIYPVLKGWESTQKMVIIKGSGDKAFCAGGDVRAVTEAAVARQPLYRDFFRAEYQLNALIGTLHIPYIALIDGITMGGGVGLSVHGRYRVATEKTLFAMPETKIGLFPDVGGSYFLSRLGGKLGLYLALSGERLKGSDVFKAGIATHLCEVSKLPALEQDLISMDLKHCTDKDIEKVLSKYHEQGPQVKKPFSLEPLLPKIDKVFTASSVEEIIQNLKSENCEWSTKLLENLSQMSPTSLKISFKVVEMGAELDLLEALKVEYRLSQRCCENKDFIEGVRALLVDKDNNPKWDPSTLEGVTPAIVESYFAPLPAELELSL